MQVSSSKESFVAAVPLRGGSKSIPFKNIKEFCGAPLCWWTLKALLGADSISRVFVTTDCDKIASVVSSLDSRIHIHRRPDHLATDTATTEAAIIDLIDACDIRDKFVVTAQVTSPQTTSNDVDAAVAHLLRTGADSLVTCARTRRFFWRDDGTPINYDPERRPLRQQWAGTLMENGAFYISTVERLKAGSSRLHGKVAVYEMDESSGIELDELADWQMLEAVFRRRMSK
jgi:N-acylneuraminate/3-deoxy-D-glycero-D-galacto-nononate cytidylyltransferase